jgi:hypothetical protein
MVSRLSYRFNSSILVRTKQMKSVVVSRHCESWSFLEEARQKIKVLGIPQGNKRKGLSQDGDYAADAAAPAEDADDVADEIVAAGGRNGVVFSDHRDGEIAQTIICSIF